MEFLRYVTRDLIERAGWDHLQEYTLVFPMQRAALFMKQHLKDEIQCAGHGRPVLSPRFTTIGQLVDDLSGLTAEDEIVSVCRLYHIFCEETHSTMPLDVFYGWGRQLLNDFSNVDMACVDARALFENASAAQELSTSQLDEDVVNRLQQLLPLHPVKKSDDGIRGKFDALWKALPTVYERFTAEQAAHGVGTVGARLKHLLASFDTIAPTLADRKFVFVGFNYLLAAERELMRRLQPQALFYWDYDPSFTTNTSAYRFIRENILQFGNCLPDIPADNTPREVNIIAATSSNAQAQFAHEWLLEHHREKQQSAVVIADETMLEPVVYALPDAVSGRANITKGFPLRNTKVYADLISFLANPKNDRREGESYSAVLSRFLDQMAVDESEERDVERKDSWHWSLMQEAFYQTRLVINRFCRLLDDGTLSDVQELKTLRNLLHRHLDMVSLPFHGEPITDIQVIGVLETRLLDFDNLLVLNVEEGVLPKREPDNSFIPYYLRKYYGMQTPDESAEVYAYNFFRLLRRAGHVTLTFSEATEGVSAKSMSRFLMQILTSPAFECRRFTLTESGVVQTPSFNLYDPAHPTLLDELRKRREADENHRAPRISPSAISSFLSCRQRFYLEQVLGIRGEEEDSVLLQANTLGSLIHASIEAAYERICGDSLPKVITPAMIRTFLKDETNLQDALSKGYEAINADYLSHHPKLNEPQHFLPEDHMAENQVALTHLRKVLENDAKLPYLELRMMEQRKYAPFSIALEDGSLFDIEVGGIIDRMDVVEEGERYLRILDYKTGRYKPEKMQAKALEDLFQESSDQTYILQTLIYCHAAAQDKRLRELGYKIMPGLLFTANSIDHFDPHLHIGDEAILNYCDDWQTQFRQALNQLLSEMLQTTDFHKCEEKNCSSYCPFHLLCGREKKKTFA